MIDLISYQEIYPSDYDVLTKIMISAFNEDTVMHTNQTEDGPPGYNDGSLVKRLNEHENFVSCKVMYGKDIVGAYSVGINQDNEYSLEMLYIDPNFRGKHIGTKVWFDIEQKFEEAVRWTVETPDYSTRNHFFYTQKCGFKYWKENVYPNGDKSFIFEKVKI